MLCVIVSLVVTRQDDRWNPHDLIDEGLSGGSLAGRFFDNYLYDKLAPCGTLHSELHVAQIGRALRVDPTRAQLAAALQHCTDNIDRCREIGRRRSRAYPDPLGFGPGWWKKTANEVPFDFQRAGLGLLHG